MIEVNKIYNADCLYILKQLPDKCIDLVLTDPPYGIGVCSMTLGNGKNKIFRGNENWDKTIPTDEIFKEIFRVSKNQIIWGGNYFANKFENKMCWLVWDKGTGDNDFADCELAWTSFDTAVRRITYRWAGMLQQNMKNKESRIHPTQKPVALYEWILSRYAKDGDIILDTHVGSASSLIACYNTNHKFVGFELDKYYYELSKKRLDAEMAQIRLSDFI